MEGKRMPGVRYDDPASPWVLEWNLEGAWAPVCPDCDLPVGADGPQGLS